MAAKEKLDLDAWIKSLGTTDLSMMLLRAGSDEAKRNAVIQFHCRRSSLSKLPTLLSNPLFRFPTLLSAEQCTSELLAAYHASLINEGETVADLTTGLGVDSIFLSQRAENLTSIEISKECHEAFVDNINALGLTNISPVKADSIAWLAEQQPETFDVGFVDPYRRDKTGGRVYSLLDSTPDVTGNLSLLLSRCKRLIIKASPMLDTTTAISQLGNHVEAIKIVGTEKECKELIFICGRRIVDNPHIEAVTLMRDGKRLNFGWQACKESTAESTYGTPLPGMILHEPFPAVSKGGAFKKLAIDFNVLPIASQTHLFLGNTTKQDGFPGHAHIIEHVLPFNKRSISEIKRHFYHINIAVRNFCMTAPELEKRLGIKSGGDKKLFGVTLHDGSKVLIITSQTFGQ